MSVSQTFLTNSKRRAYTSRACIECRRRKTKCTEEQPCPGCRTRQVACKYSDHYGRHRSARTKSVKSRSGEDNQAEVASAPVSRPNTTDSHHGNGALNDGILRSLHEPDIFSNSRQLVNAPQSSHITAQAAAPIPVSLSPSLLFGSTPGYEPDREVNSSQTDTFNPFSTWSSPFAVANKVRAIRCNLPAELDTWTSSLDETKTVAITLPPPNDLRCRVNTFLAEFGYFYAFLRPSRVRKLITSTLRSLSYKEEQTTVRVTYRECTTVAILCNIFSDVESTSDAGNTTEPRSSLDWHLQGKSLTEEFEGYIQDSVDVVVYHSMVAGNMMMSERLRTAAVHVAKATHAALSLGLNNQKLWKNNPEEIASRSCLWWALYFQDKRVHWKCGMTYMLRPSDVNVDEQISSSDEPEIELTKLQLIQTSITYCKLWTSIWHDFLSPNAPHVGDWTEIQTTDARILISYKQTPSQISWATEKIDEYLWEGDTASQMWQRLQVYLWYELLRVTIRQSRILSAQADLERRRSRFSVCQNIIAAVACFLDHLCCVRPVGYILTCTLVECVFHIKDETSEPIKCVDPQDSNHTLDEAVNQLEKLALSFRSAHRALAALRCVLRKPPEARDSTITENLAEDPSSLGWQDNDMSLFEDHLHQPNEAYEANIAETLQYLGLIPA